MFAYCANNPVIRFDSAGKLWDYALDIGFVAWSAHDAIREPDDWKNWAALAVDVVFAVIPFVPSGVGQVIKVGNKVDNATDIVNAINKIDNIQDVTKATMIGRNMNRVTSAAGLMGITDNLYKVWTGYDKVSEFSKSLANALSAIHNGGWLFEKLRQGYTVFDIGLSTLHQSKGLWYGTERLVSALWETRNIWKLPLHLLP